jgi:CMP-N,N'-diacetyllegionaminic acid synthase
MKKYNKILVYIPARGGSKGVPHKNVKRLNGKPLIDYTLNIVNQLRSFLPDQIIPFVSTDSELIMDQVSSLGFKNEYRRPEYLSDDKATIVDGIFHAIEWLYINKNLEPSTVLLLQPTSPIREINDAINLISKFTNNDLESMFSVVPMHQHPYECLSLKNEIWDYLVDPGSKSNQRQDYSSNFYFIDGAYYIAKFDFLKKHKTFIDKELSTPYIINNKYAIDIDEPIHFEIASAVLKFLNNE